MDLYTYDEQGRQFGLVEAFSSLQWNRRYAETGNFILHCPTKYKDILQEDFLLWPEGDGEAGIIQSREFQRNREGKETLVVAGKFLTGVLNWRILWDTVTFAGTYENLMRQLVDKNAVRPTDPDRVIDRLLLGSPRGLPDSLGEYSAQGTKLDVAVANLSKESEIGHRILFDPDTGLMYFDVYKGLDRTEGQRENNSSIFSATYENLQSGQYRTSKLNTANVALASGTNDAKETVTVVAGSGKGWGRQEIYVDARSVRQKLEDGSLLTSQQFADALRQHGLEKVALAARVESADAQIQATDNSVYRRDYDTGDLVTVHFDQWGVSANVRLSEIQEITEQGGTTVYAIFGKDAWLPLQYVEE